MSFDSEITAALDDIQSEVGRDVVLKRGADQITVTAVPGRTRTEVDGDQTGKVDGQIRDYLIKVSDYDFGDGPVLPESGDEIIDQSHTHELQDLSDAMPCWSYSDRGETYFRVHTRQIR